MPYILVMTNISKGNLKVPIVLEGSVNHRLAVVAAQSKRLVYRVMAKKGLEITPDQWTILNYLWQDDGLSLGDLARKTRKDFANITRVVERLIRDGYVRKQKDLEDGRSYRVFKLPKADAIRPAVQELFAVMADLTLSGISLEEQSVLLELLQKIESNVESRLNEEGGY